MKKTMIKLVSLLLCLAFLPVGCGKKSEDRTTDDTLGSDSGAVADIGEKDDSFGDDAESFGFYDGYFEEKAVDVSVTCISGTQGAYTLEGSTLTFSEIKEDSVYSVSGKLYGNIVIDVGDEYKFDLEMHGLSLVCGDTNPIYIKSGDEISITAKKDFKNYIYDTREAVAQDDDTVFAGAIYSLTDLELCGKGELTVVSLHNNGVHSKDDVEIKNLTLRVLCEDNAVRGNDSVEITSGHSTLIAKSGDGIKTSNSAVSSKGNQKGTVSILGGEHTIYAACDGIDAAYDAVIDGENTVLKIYTDKYSAYSEEVWAVDEEQYYIRFTSKDYKYSIKYYNSEDDVRWVDAEYHSSVSGGRINYYYYSFPKDGSYGKMQLFIYSSEMEQGQEDEYLTASDYLTPSEDYDTFALMSRGGYLSYSWTNYTTTIQDGPGGMGGPGGMQDGNTDKGNHSTKGIKAANEIRVLSGSVTIKAYDDALHANNDTVLESGEAPTGNVTISGGAVSLYSNDDALHADGVLTVSGGTVNILNSYEGLEGSEVIISGGYVSVVSSDDGINATSTSGKTISVSGGTIYVYAGGDGFDSNSRTSYGGVVFSGGNTVVFSVGSANSSIDTEQGYSYTGGAVVAVMTSGGMTSEAKHCKDFSSVGTARTISLSAGDCLTVTVGGNTAATVKVPRSFSAYVVYLGSNSASISSKSSTDVSLDENGVSFGPDI